MASTNFWPLHVKWPFHTTSGAPQVCSVPISFLGMNIATPSAASKKFSESPISITISTSLLRLVVWASAAGIYMNYNAAASANTVPVPTTPLTLDINATDAALLQFYGDGAKTLHVIQMG